MISREREREKKNIRRRSLIIYTQHRLCLFELTVCVCVMVYLADIRGAKSRGSIILWSAPSPSAMSIESTTQTRNIPIDLDFPFFSLSLLSCVYYLERDGLSPWVYGWLCVFVFLHRCHNTQPPPPPANSSSSR